MYSTYNGDRDDLNLYGYGHTIPMTTNAPSAATSSVTHATSAVTAPNTMTAVNSAVATADISAFMDNVSYTPQLDFHPSRLVPVDRSSQVWVQIESKVQATLTTAIITDIQQIYNTWLWNPYEQSRERLSDKNNGVTNEMYLFHGTSRTPPDQIHSSEKGFDFRFAGKGLWGEGAYFAVNSQYSDAYAHVLTDGKRQIFLASVLTGESCSCSENRSLKMPPVKDTGDIRFVGECYDSVRGHARGSDIYVVYDHHRSYPAYLITYTLH